MDGPLTLLALSVIALGVGPVLHQVLSRVPATFAFLEGLVLSSLGILLLLHVIPDAAESLGGWVVIPLVLGLAGPWMLERALGAAASKVHAGFLLLALAGLAVHTCFDGVALATGHAHGEPPALGLAIVVHRLPVGLAVWWLVRPNHGRAKGLAVIGLIIVMTIVGFFASERLLGDAPQTAGAIVQAFVGGSLLHVLIHPAERHAEGHALSETFGFFTGILLVVFGAEAGHDHGGSAHGFADRLVHLCLETAPALVIGYALAGAVVEWLPRASIDWVSRGGHLARATRGVVFGLPIPICSCGVVPVYDSLVRRGLPATAGLAFLVATPELGIESLLLSLPLLGVNLTVARLLAAGLVALGVGWAVGRLIPTYLAHDHGEEADDRPQAATDKLKRALRFGFVEVVEHTAAWIILGIAIAAAIEPAALTGALGSLPPGADIIIFALLGLPLYVCASGATPLAAALIAAGASPGAGIAFLLAGPATNITTFGVLSGLHGRRPAVLFGLGVFIAAIACGFGVNAVLGAEVVLPAFTGHGARLGVVSWLCLGIIGTTYGIALIRIGPRAFLSTLSSGDPHPHDHDHHHDHDHDHDHHGHSHAH